MFPSHRNGGEECDVYEKVFYEVLKQWSFERVPSMHRSFKFLHKREI